MPDASDLSRVVAVAASCSRRRAAGAKLRLIGNKEKQFSTGETAEQPPHLSGQILKAASSYRLLTSKSSTMRFVPPLLSLRSCFMCKAGALNLTPQLRQIHLHE